MYSKSGLLAYIFTEFQQFTPVLISRSPPPCQLSLPGPGDCIFVWVHTQSAVGFQSIVIIHSLNCHHPSVKFFRNLPGKSHVMTFFTFSSCDHFSSLTTETDIHFTFTLKLFLTSLSVDNSSHDKKIPTTYWYCIEQSGMHHKENHHCCSTAPETQMTFVLSRPAVYQEYHKIFIIGQLIYLIYNR